MNEQHVLKELLEWIQSDNPYKEFDWGEDVGRERIWSMTDEEYEKEYSVDEDKK